MQNRHCPKCGTLERERWLDNREADLLPVIYMHMVFTIPDKLNPLFLHHQTDCYNILFRVVNQVMTGIAANPRFLDACIGYTAILHTWDQNLQYHPHLHLVVPAGGITRNNRWKSSKADGSFLFPVDQLSSGFLSSAAKNKALAALREYFCLPPGTEHIKISWQTIARERMGIEAQCCKKCVMQIIRTIPDRSHRPIRAPSYSALC